MSLLVCSLRVRLSSLSGHGDLHCCHPASPLHPCHILQETIGSPRLVFMCVPPHEYRHTKRLLQRQTLPFLPPPTVCVLSACSRLSPLLLIRSRKCPCHPRQLVTSSGKDDTLYSSHFMLRCGPCRVSFTDSVHTNGRAVRLCPKDCLAERGPQ